MKTFIHTIRTRALEHATEHALVYVGIMIAASASVYAGTLHTPSHNLSTTVPQISSLVETISSQGAVSPSSVHEIVVNTQGLVSYTAVKEGDVVTTGSVLVALDMTDARVERARLERDLVTYEQAYQSLSGERAHKDVDVALVQTQSRIRNLQKEIRHLDDIIVRGEVRAPFDGVVQKVLVDTSDSISPSDVVVVMQPASAYEVMVKEGERTIPLGVSANITLLSGKAYPATVVTKKVTQSSTYAIVVPQEDVLGLDQADEVRVDILAAAHPETMTIPREYVSMLNERFGEVRVKHGDSYAVRLVEVGAFGDNGQVEIVSGLRKTDVVVK